MCLLPSSRDKVLNDPKSFMTFASFAEISFLKIRDRNLFSKKMFNINDIYMRQALDEVIFPPNLLIIDCIVTFRNL